MLKLKLNISLFVIVLMIFNSCGILRKTDDDTEKIDLRTRNFNFNRHFLEGARQKTLGNYDAALKNYSFAMRVDDTEPAVYYEIAGILTLMGDFTGALEYAQKAVKLDKHNNEFYRILLADIYQRNNMLSKAAEVYEELIKINPEQIHYYFELSEIYFSLGNTRRAIRSLNRAENRFGVLDFISLEKERIYRLTGDKRRAVAEIENLSNKYPDRIEYKVLLAETYIQSNMPEKAKETFDNIDFSNVSNGMIFFSAADFYRIIEDYDRTFELLQKGFAAQDVDLDIKIKMMINMVSFMGEDQYIYDNASKLMEVLLISYPDNVKVRTLNTDFLIFDEKYEQAQKEFDFILKHEKGKFLIWEQALFLDHYLDDYESMFYRSKEAAELFPNQPILLLFYSISAFQTENFEDAIKAGISARQIIINDNEMLIQILNFKAEAYRELDRYSDAFRVFEDILRINPNETIILNNYSYYLAIRNEELDKALEMSTKLMTLDNSRPSFLDTHAWVLYKNGKYEDALKYIKLALDSDAQSPAHLEHKGDILYKLSQKEKAVKYWEKALELGGYSDLLEEKVESRTLIE